jgi:phage protein D
VASVGPNLTTTRVVGHPASFTLLRRFVEQTYENKTAGAMVRDLCNRASVDVATADDGITFPAYVVDGRRSFYRHILDLAELSGLDAYINADGKLVFEKFVGGKTVHVFEYAKQILELEVHRAPALASQVTTFGESPGGGRGANAWAWLTRDFSGLKGTAGSGNSMLLLERSPLRTAEAARAAADAAFTTIDRRTLRGRLVTYGTPEVKLGDAIKLQQVPDDSLNRSFQVRGVKHRIHKVAGFTTTIEFRKIGD